MFKPTIDYFNRYTESMVCTANEIHQSSQRAQSACSLSGDSQCQQYSENSQHQTKQPERGQVHYCEVHDWQDDICSQCGQMQDKQIYIDQRKFSFHKKAPIDKQIKDQLLFSEFQQKCAELGNDRIPQDILREVFRQVEVIMKHSDIKGNKLFKLYLFVISQTMKQMRGRPVISKQLALLSGISSLPEYNSRWLYQGHKLYQQFNFSYNPNMLANNPIPLENAPKTPGNTKIWTQLDQTLFTALAQRLATDFPGLEQQIKNISVQGQIWLFLIINIVDIQMEQWILSTHTYNVQLKFILALALSGLAQVQSKAYDLQILNKGGELTQQDKSRRHPKVKGGERVQSILVEYIVVKSSRQDLFNQNDLVADLTLLSQHLLEYQKMATKEFNSTKEPVQYIYGVLQLLSSNQQLVNSDLQDIHICQILKLQLKLLKQYKQAFYQDK